jgi:hypothetical protein
MAKNDATEATWKFDKDAESSILPSAPESVKDKSLSPIEWVINESVFKEKTVGWYFVLGFSALIFAALVYLLTRDKITTGFIIFCAAIFGYYAGHRPHPIRYKLEDDTIMVDEKSFKFDVFKSFFVVDDHGIANLILLPQKRFSPGLTVLAEPKNAEKVIDYLSQHLPLDKNREDTIDKFFRRINF